MIFVKDGVFCLLGKDYSYGFYVLDGKLIHTYYGKKVFPLNKFGEIDTLYMVKPCVPVFELPSEYGEFGRGDFLAPSLVVRTEQTCTTDFRYLGYEILKEKPNFTMPALRGGEHLVVRLEDSVQRLRLNLYYSVYEEGLVRRAELINESQKMVTLDKLMSFCLDLPNGAYETLDLYGRANAERNYQREKVSCAIRNISSTRGITSHQHNPFLAILEEGANEDDGEVYAFNLIYSGNFDFEQENDGFSKLRINTGMKILHGGIPLSAGERFSSPETVSVYSADGLGEMSRKFHRLYRKHLLNEQYVDTIRPIVLNSWESLVFDINEKSLKGLIDSAKGLGIDMFVLDDGWFRKRSSDDCSLGDWTINQDKLPNGLEPVAQYCKTNGMRFGLWFEPEAINPDSDLYRAHPDWAIQTQGYEGVQFRNQYTLDFSRREVVDYVFDAMKRILHSADISYVKWDMNRSMTEVPNASVYHKHVLGVYALYERLLEEFPHLFIEGCSSGGGRFDPAILAYSPMIWTSDNTDAYDRAKIQYSTSLCYPLQVMSNHVSVSPNLQTGRVTPFETRGAIASLGALGYELNLTKESVENKQKVKEQIEAYRKDAKLILTGDLYRIKNPHTDGDFAFLVLSTDKREGYFVYLRGVLDRCMPTQRVRLKGLRLDGIYEVQEYGVRYSGADLCFKGVELKLGQGDFVSRILHLKEV